jgi:hypothetical protein
MPYVGMIFAMLYLIGFEWYRYLVPLSPPHPVFMTVLGLLVAGCFVWKIIQLKTRVRTLITGMKGEKAVAERLVELQGAGYKVLHDIPGKAWNIDHVVIGPAGVFTIETKTCRKRRSPNAKVRYDGQCISVDGMTPQRDPLAQALSEAAELRTVIQKSTGKVIAVQPVIIYPGWYVEQLAPSPKVWVLNDKYFVKHLKDQPRRLDDGDLHLIAFHLEQYVRAKADA